MSCTIKQEQLIEHLQSNGAPIPSKDGGDPDYSYLKSVEEADIYIKRNYSFYTNKFGVSPKTVIEGMDCPKS